MKLKNGSVIIFYTLVDNTEFFKYKNKEYYYYDTTEFYRTVKFYRYSEGDPMGDMPKKNPLNRNLDLELSRKENRYFNLFIEKKSPLDKLLEMAAPFFMGLIIGVAALMIQYSDCILK